MVTNEQAQAEQGQEQETNKPEINLEELTNTIRDEFKAELSGLNRRIGELTKEKEEVARAAEEEAKAKLTVSERLAKIEEDLVRSRQEAANERHRAEMTKRAMEMLEQAKLPASVINKIDISSEESIVADIEMFASLFNGFEHKAKDDTRRKYAFTPGDGEAVKSVPKSLKDCKTLEEKKAYLMSKKE